MRDRVYKLLEVEDDKPITLSPGGVLLIKAYMKILEDRNNALVQQASKKVFPSGHGVDF